MNAPIAYFCTEYATEDDLPIYAGGLGILAGDLVRQAGEMNLPWVAIGLLYQRGFDVPAYSAHVRPPLNPRLSGFELLTGPMGETVTIPIEIYERSVYARVWHKQYRSAHLYLLDTNTDHNSTADRLIAEFLYDERFETRLLQEVVLGIGGVKLLRHLRINPTIYHLNEGHTSFAILALTLEYLHDHPEVKTFTGALLAVREKIVATKHTILPSAGLYFTSEQFKRVISCYFEKHHANFDEFFSLGTDSDPIVFSATKFLLAGSIRSSAVSKLHAFFEKERHPHSPLVPITNGVYAPRWLGGRWPKNPTQLADAELWNVHTHVRRDLLQYVEEKTGARLDPEALTIVWARRFATYKRPGLLFSDMNRLRRIVQNSQHPVQCIIAGQAHPSDREGKELIERIIAYAKSEQFKGKIVYVPKYSLRGARLLTAGADIWLNTPERGKEACGTSGMKSALNGGLQFSVLDGWIGEVDWTDKGWILPEINTAEMLYAIIENEIVPTFYTRDAAGIPRGWVSRMRATMVVAHQRYTLSRTITEYFEKLYAPANYE